MKHRLQFGLAIMLTISMTCSVQAMDSEDAATERATASTSQSHKRSNQEDYSSPDSQLEVSSENQEDPKQNLRKVAKAAIASPSFLSLAQDPELDQDPLSIDDTRAVTASVMPKIDDTRACTASAYPLTLADQHWLSMYPPTPPYAKKQEEFDGF